MPTSKAISASKLLGKDRYEYYLNELLTEQTIGGQKLSKSQIKEAFSKRKNKISFEKFVDSLITTKTAKAAIGSPITGKSPVAYSKGVDFKSRAIVKSPTSIEKYDGVISKPQKPGAVEQSLAIIAKSMTSIATILAGKKKLEDDSAAYDKRKAEQEKRALAENKLEKRFDGLKKAAEKVLAPVKSILDRITDFLVNVLLGRIVFKLIEWWGDPKNADKVRSIIRFFGDHWPKLLALYLTFGTSFGRFALGLSRAVARGAVKLLAKIAMLAAAKKMRGARGVAKFLGGGKGKLLANVVGTGVAVGGAYALTQGLKGDGGEQKAQGLVGGGYVRPKFPTFSGGGFNFKGMMGGTSMGAMFGPLGMLLGGALGSGKPQEMVSGFVSGEKGVDKVPAMLSDGEFVMSRGAVQKYGVDTLEAMNAAGGGTNKPKMVSGTTYAQGGGMIGETDKEKIIDPILEKRKKIIASQLQAQKALSTGKGLNIKGASIGRELGTGYGAKYQGRDSIVIKGGAANMDLSVTLAGKQYYGMKKGNDAVYSAVDSRDVSGGGFLQPGGFLGGPRMSARMDYAESKGKYYSSSDRKTYANYNDAKAARQSRMVSLASQQRLNRLSSQGAGPRTGRGIRYTAEAKAQAREDIKRGGFFGQLGRLGTRMFGGEEGRKKLAVKDAASTARVKQAGASSIGRYYSSSDGKYYKDYNAAVQAKKIRLAKQQKKTAPSITPLPKPKPKAYSPSGGGMNGARGGGSNVKVKTPNFGATCPASGNAKAKTLGVRK